MNTRLKPWNLQRKPFTAVCIFNRFNGLNVWLHNWHHWTLNGSRRFARFSPNWVVSG